MQPLVIEKKPRYLAALETNVRTFKCGIIACWIISVNSTWLWMLVLYFPTLHGFRHWKLKHWNRFKVCVTQCTKYSKAIASTSTPKTLFREQLKLFKLLSFTIAIEKGSWSHTTWKSTFVFPTLLHFIFNSCAFSATNLRFFFPYLKNHFSTVTLSAVKLLVEEQSHAGTVKLDSSKLP